MIKRTIWFFVFALMAISCLDQPDCFSLNNNFVGISFKKLSNNSADTVAVDQLIADETENVFLREALVTGINLPLNFYKDSTVFSFSKPDKVYDLIVRYSSKAQFVSEECGERFALTDLKAFSETFDSVRVVASTPKGENVAGTNIEIYRCPEPNVIKIRFLSAVTITKIETSYATVKHPSSAVTTLRLPLNPAAPNSIFKFTFSDQSTKSLSLTYKVEPKQLFRACGEQVVISNIAVSKVPDSLSVVKVVRTGIQNPNLTNIEINR